jgi:TRAP transporter TAXI family solute receptor
MKTVISAWLAIASCVIGLSSTASAGEQFILATGQPQAPAYAAGIGIASLVKFELSPRYKIDLQAITSSGPVDNVQLMRKAVADFAILPSATGYAARAGIGSFAGQAPEHRLRAIATLWRDALHLVVRGDKASSGTIEDFLQLKGQKVFLGGKATSTVDANHLLISAFGLDIDKAFEVSPPPDGDAVNAIINGNLDAFSIMSKPPSPMFRNLSESHATTLKFLDITGDQMIAANGSHWLWTPYTIPATTYPGQANDIATMAHSTLLVANADLSEETVYLITKSIFENLPYLHRVDPVLSGLTMDQALFGMSLPLHPGALRYFKETGFIPGASDPLDTSDPKAPSRDDEPSNLDATGYPNPDVADIGSTANEGRGPNHAAPGVPAALAEGPEPAAGKLAESTPPDDAS